MYAYELSKNFTKPVEYKSIIVDDSQIIKNDLSVTDEITCNKLNINNGSSGLTISNTSGTIWKILPNTSSILHIGATTNRIPIGCFTTVSSTIYDLVTSTATFKYGIDDCVIIDGSARTFTMPTMVLSCKGANMNSRLITNVLDPVSDQDAATKYYVDTALSSYLTNTNAAINYVAKSDLAALSYSIVPSTTLTYDLGSSSFYYSNVYANNLIGDVYKIGKYLSLTDMYIAHSAQFTSTNYAFGQTAAGDTSINCYLSNSIQLMYNGGNSLMKLQYNAVANQITIYGNLFPSINTTYSLGTTSNYFLNVFTSAVVGVSYKLGALSSIMYLAHNSNFSTSNFAISQNAAGATLVNAVSGQSVRITNNGATNLFSFSSTACTTYQNLVPTTTNTLSLGTASLLYTTLYATNATINTSDQDKKQNISTIDDSVALNFIRQLNPVKFQWKPTISVDMEGNTITNIDQKYYPGFIAQEIYNMETVDTDFIEQNVVSREEDSNGVYWGVRYTSIIPPLVKYVQILPDNLVPSQDDLYDIGSSDKRYQDLYLSGQVFNTSDSTQKENIKDADLDKSVGLINMLKSKEYNFIGKSVRRVGLIAQQVSEVLYNLDIDHNIVKKTTSKDGSEIYALDYMALIPHLITYSQHLFEKNKKLEDRLNKLEHIFSETNSLLTEVKKNRERTAALKSPRKSVSP